jgi:hypothetical protein
MNGPHGPNFALGLNSLSIVIVVGGRYNNVETNLPPQQCAEY